MKIEHNEMIPKVVQSALCCLLLGFISSVAERMLNV